jgi:hypothetical protein
MEKVKQSFWKEYLPLRLFRDDVDVLYSLIATNCKEATIVIDNMKLADISELNKIEKPRVFDLNITGKEPYIEIDLSNRAARITHLDSDDIHLQGLTVKIEEVFKKRARLLRILASLFNTGKIWILTLALIMVPWFLPSDQKIALALFLGSPLLFLCCFLWAWIINFKRHSMINLCHSASSKNFIQRNKDQIIMTILSHVIVGTLAYLGGILTMKFMPWFSS